MKFNQQRIEDLKNGVIALDNTECVDIDLLQEILKEAFPRDTLAMGRDDYYFRLDDVLWKSSNSSIEIKTRLKPKQFLSENEEPKEFIVPQNWVIQIKPENKKTIQDWCTGKDLVGNCGFYDDQFLYFNGVEGFFTWNMDCKQPGYDDKTYTPVTIEQFEKHIAKVVPSIKTNNWFITTTEESNDLVCDWYEDNNTRNDKSNRIIGVHYGIDKNGIVGGKIPSATPSDYYDEEITFEQFKKYILKPVGYKVPFDITTCDYKKGDVLTLSDNINFYSLNKKGKTLPREIVETWKPSYKPTKTVVTISKSREVTVSTGKIKVEGKLISIDDLIKLTESSLNNLSGWDITLTDIKYKIGCWEDVTLADLNLILDSYNKLNEKR